MQPERGNLKPIWELFLTPYLFIQSVPMLHPPIQQRLWIETGYRHFAEEGPSELKIKNIAHDAGVSRTTFYHFFADMPDFIDQLLEHHHKRAKEIAADFKRCKTYIPDVFNVIEASRTAFFFHRQLLIHKDNPVFYLTYQVLNKLSDDIIFPLWAENFGFKGSSLVGKEIHGILRDLWYLQLSPEDRTCEDFVEHANRIRRQLRNFADSHHGQALTAT